MTNLCCINDNDLELTDLCTLYTDLHYTNPKTVICQCFMSLSLPVFNLYLFILSYFLPYLNLLLHILLHFYHIL